MATDTMRKWKLYCEQCDVQSERWEWASKFPLSCEECSSQLFLWSDKFDKAPSIIGDEIPGGIEIRHLDPEAKRYYSKTDIKRRCNELGWNWADDTPGPYKVPWSGRRKEPERPAPLTNATKIPVPTK